MAGSGPGPGPHPSPDPPSSPTPRPATQLAILTVPIGGEAILIRELAELGVRARTRAPGEVQLRGDRDTLARVAREVRCGTDLRAPEGADPIEPQPAEPLVAPGDDLPRVVAALALRALRSFASAEVFVLPGSGRALEREASLAVGSGETRGGVAGEGDADRELAVPPAATRTESDASSAAAGRECGLPADIPAAGRPAPPERTAQDAVPTVGSLLLCAFPGGEDATVIAASLAAQLRERRRGRHAVLSRVADLDVRAGRAAARRWTFGAGEGAWTLLLFEPGPAEETSAGERPLRGRPPEAVAAGARAAPRGDPASDEARFGALVAENAWLRRRWPERQRLDCYRLYDRDLATIPWTVDRYADALHITIYPPAEGETASTAAAEGRVREERLLLAAGAALGAEPERIFVKRKGKRRRGVQHEVVGRERQTRIVVENGLRFLVNLSDYVDTGLFLDQRLARQRVREEARGKRFLNLFCYTASFTVAAAAGGAAETVSVDTSQVYLDWARENLRLNRLDGGAHRFVRADAMRFLREHPPGVAYELAVVDPPTTSVRHGEVVWDVQRDHAELLALLRPLVADGGTVLFSTNFRGFRLERALPWWMVEETTPASIPADFRDRRVHRAFRLVAVGKGGG